jgi:hypothetical protein
VVGLPGAVTGEEEGDELYREDVTGDKGLADLLVESEYAGTHGVENAGLLGHGLGAHQKLHDDILAQVVGQKLLKGTVHGGGIEILFGGNIDAVELRLIGIKSCHMLAS